MTNLRKVFLTMLVIILLGATVVFATTDDTGTIVITGTNTNTVNTANTQNTANTVNTLNTLNTANTSNYTNTNLPQTGANDYAMVLIIGIFAVSAVYAYKKINEYKNI